MANCPKCGEFMLPSCKKCGSDLIEKDVIRKFIAGLRLQPHNEQNDIAMALMLVAAEEIADLLEKEINEYNCVD